MTVAWMLSTLVTVAAEAVSLAAQSLTWFGVERPVFSALAGLMLWSSLITGTVSLLLLPLVYHFRTSPPPTPITWVAVAAALVPWLILTL